jgi:hypothetical protein
VLSENKNIEEKLPKTQNGVHTAREALGVKSVKAKQRQGSATRKSGRQAPTGIELARIRRPPFDHTHADQRDGKRHLGMLVGNIADITTRPHARQCNQTLESAA